MPSAAYAARISSRAALASAAIWSRSQKMWASLSCIARTLVSPPSTPDSSARYWPPISARRSGSSR